MSRSARDQARAVSVPASRIARFARMGSMTTGIAGATMLNAAREVGRGKRPALRDLLIAPANIKRLADELAHMRGAAMKMGQLLSMDAGDVLPPELADILARLRDNAHYMPPKQLKQVLNTGWGPGWLKHFKTFDVHPIAAASIGQVHRATLKDGRVVAIKVQYPGVARSIDSDVSNVGALVKLSGLLPKGFDIAPFLDEARAQLHEETDYLLEGAHLRSFGELLRGDARFEVPEYFEEWSTPNILTMSFVKGTPIEDAASLGAEERNRIAASLIDLLLAELFDHQVIQSDPNFANYRYNADTGRIVLLDFGATRRIAPAMATDYRHLFAAGLAGDADGVAAAARAIGFLTGEEAPEHSTQILRMINTVFAALRASALYDFGAKELSQQMHREGMALAESGYVPPVLPMDALFLQRKFGGMFLLAARLQAHLPVMQMLERHVQGVRPNAA